jgi:exosome complex component RRP40
MKKGNVKAGNDNKEKLVVQKQEIKKCRNNLDKSHTKNDLIPVKKVLLFPGEQYEFKDKLIHYDAFGYTSGNLVSKKCGILLCDDSGNILENANEEIFKSLGKYYSPKVDDPVIGTIVQKTSEFYRIDIGSYTNAILNTKDFEGATKKAKPNLNLGDLIFARVGKVNKFDAPILTCISQTETKTWSTGESYFGNLKGGNVFNFDKIYTWEFYKDNFAILRLYDILSFEIIIGFNGRMWIKADDPDDIYNIYEILINSLSKPKQEIEKDIYNKYIEKINK